MLCIVHIKPQRFGKYASAQDCILHQYATIYQQGLCLHSLSTPFKRCGHVNQRVRQPTMDKPKCDFPVAQCNGLAFSLRLTSWFRQYQDRKT